MSQFSVFLFLPFTMEQELPYTCPHMLAFLDRYSHIHYPTRALVCIVDYAHTHMYVPLYILSNAHFSIHILLGMVFHTYPHVHYPLYMPLYAYSLYTLICPLPHIFLCNTLSYTYSYIHSLHIHSYAWPPIHNSMYVLSFNNSVRQTPTELNRPYGRRVIPSNQEINLSQVGNTVSMVPTAGTLDFLTLHFLSKAS